MLKKILQWNLGICIGICFLDFVLVEMLFLGLPDKTYLGILFLFLSLSTVGIQALGVLVLSMYFYFMKKKELGKYFLMSLIVVLLIGIPLSFLGLLL